MSRHEMMERAVRRGKYAPLFRFLMERQENRMEFTFREIEAILGFTLPESARLYRPWWANQGKAGHSQCMAWSVAGWRTTAVDLEKEVLCFERDGHPPEPSGGANAPGPSGKQSIRRYWVYENWTHKKAVIHVSSCPFCNDGRGIHSESTSRNGQWHGPLDSIDDAHQRAEATGRAEVRECKVCTVSETAQPESTEKAPQSGAISKVKDWFSLQSWRGNEGGSRRG